MAAPKGNRFWEARTRSGPRLKYDNADDLWNDCVEYFEWVEDNPLMVAEPVKFQGKGKLMKVPRLRAMTIGGLCGFLGIAVSTWYEWRGRNDLSEIVTRAEEIIRQQKFEGAAAELLNPNIIARDLGLVDKKDMTTDGKPINEIAVSYDE